jgi:hypothetical protein
MLRFRGFIFLCEFKYNVRVDTFITLTLRGVLETIES